MASAPAVSVITIFLNEERFIREAVESVLAQTRADWELILVDDGSTDASSAIARQYAAEQPGRIRYLEHAGHANRGMSASRNLGARQARGKYLALLDADDVWLETKLERQIPRLEGEPKLDMVYGSSLFWYGWTDAPRDRERDFSWQPIAAERRFEPPTLLSRFLLDEVRMPCPGSILMRKELIERIGGWEESFRGLFEDQVFFSKVCLSATVLVTPELTDRYRQHENSCCALGDRSGETGIWRRRFFDWLTEHLARAGMRGTESWESLERARAASAAPSAPDAT